MQSTMSAQQQTLKRTREDDVVVQPASERGKKLYMPNDFDKVSTVITDELKIKKDESGKMVDQTLMPKLVLEDQPDSQYALYVNTPPLTVQFSTLQFRGNSGKFGFTDSDYKYEMKTRQGLPDRVSAKMPGAIKRQEEFWKFIKTTCSEMLVRMYNAKNRHAKDSLAGHVKKADKLAKKNGTTGIEEFTKAAQLSQFHDYEAKDGKDIEMFQTKRSGIYDGVDQRPVFWKNSAKGFQVMNEVKYLSPGSVVIYQIGFKIYSNPSKYGISCTLGKNIIVVFEQKSEISSYASAAPEVPYDF